MAKNILKEAIADAKAVREVALANAKAALEEAFTPRLQSMLSAKLSETLNEEEDDLDESKEEIEETYYEDDSRADKEMDETTYMEGEKEDLDEEIDLEEILNELELEEAEDSKEETVDEAKKDDDDKVEEGKNDDEDTVDEAKDDKEEEKIDEMEVNYKAETANRAGYKAEYVHEGNENFNLDALLEEINNLDEQTEEEMEQMYAGSRLHKRNEGQTNEVVGALAVAGIMIGALPLMAVQGAVEGMSPEEAEAWKGRHPNLAKLMDVLGATAQGIAKGRKNFEESAYGDTYQEASGDMDASADKASPDNNVASSEEMAKAEAELAKTMGESTINSELEETKAALEAVRSELNEVNLLNSKLLYVNRIFKANNLNEAQKLRVVETLDNASNVKEAKLIDETIKDTFNVAKSTKTTPKKSIREGLGMASKAAGLSTAPKRPVLNESNDMVARMQKLANIKINQ